VTLIIPLERQSGIGWHRAISVGAIACDNAMRLNWPVRLSVIIPTLNEAANVTAAIESAWRAGAAEVVVADGGSSDETAQVIRGQRCEFLVAPRGRAAQQNAGARAATGDVLLFLHADNRLGAVDIARQVELALIDPRRLHGALCQQIDAPAMVYRWLERGNAARVRWLGLPYGDQAIFVRRGVFFEQGGFPCEPLLEDLLLMQRLRRQAWPALLAGPVVVSPRRWQRHGVIGQTMRNWWLLVRHACGAKPADLAGQYRRHDQDR
jgi:rSAM/selenodomain-associated transferase 2